MIGGEPYTLGLFDTAGMNNNKKNREFDLINFILKFRSRRL
jgi:hypothetical protein